MRRGKRRLIIDIVFKNPDGTTGRFRRDAEVQTLAAARAEERRRLAALVETGSPASERLHRPDASPTGISLPTTPSTVASTAPFFREVVDDYLDDFAASHLKPSTKRGYEVVLRTFLVLRLGDLRIDSIDATTARALDAEMARRKTRPSTRRNVQIVLRSVLCRYAVEAKLIPEAPKLPSLPRVGTTIVSVLSHDDVRALIAATDDAYRVGIMLAAYAGLRAGEVRGLRWRDVDLATGRLVVRQSVCRGVAATPKSGHERVIPLVPELKEALDRIANRPRDGFVTTNSNEPWTEFALAKAFKRSCKKAGLVGWRFHDLRHAFVTALFRVGVGAPTVQALAGHSDLKTTQRYAHAAQVDLEAAIARLRGNGVVTGR
jgi:integrase